MAYLCLACNEIYTDKMERCPKASCGCDKVIEVDELMLPIIMELNEKGYATDSCCSGHFYDKYSTPYIMFSDCVFEDLNNEEIAELFSNLPDPWHIDEIAFRSGYFCIRARMLDGMNRTEMHKYIVNANIALLEFVDKLPCM